eukprot:jgi/Bigna1/73495/fgenesh1_pg.24_\
MFQWRQAKATCFVRENIHPMHFPHTRDNFQNPSTTAAVVVGSSMAARRAAWITSFSRAWALFLLTASSFCLLLKTTSDNVDYRSLGGGVRRHEKICGRDSLWRINGGWAQGGREKRGRGMQGDEFDNEKVQDDDEEEEEEAEKCCGSAEAMIEEPTFAVAADEKEKSLLDKNAKGKVDSDGLPEKLEIAWSQSSDYGPEDNFFGGKNASDRDWIFHELFPDLKPDAAADAAEADPSSKKKISDARKAELREIAYESMRQTKKGDHYELAGNPTLVVNRMIMSDQLQGSNRTYEDARRIAESKMNQVDDQGSGERWK